MRSQGRLTQPTSPHIPSMWLLSSKLPLPSTLAGSLLIGYAAALCPDPGENKEVGQGSVELKQEGRFGSINIFSKPSLTPNVQVIFLSLLKSLGLNISIDFLPSLCNNSRRDHLN